VVALVAAHTFVPFPSLSEWSLSGAYVGYVVFAALSTVFALRYLRETKGERLEEIGRGLSPEARSGSAGSSARPR
jgi:hypothetical protein